ncbi:unnamed protein product [Protopolystoma xenopodis]|uniref:C2H2-type domain-containing protein n=1 Tax=Protopolystoma xenopodis TaxID=117903 RepID=A0A3S5A3A7_9PLAT|nr:unnamed protein product [Protopolystoma xenopodis]
MCTFPVPTPPLSTWNSAFPFHQAMGGTNASLFDPASTAALRWSQLAGTNTNVATGPTTGHMQTGASVQLPHIDGPLASAQTSATGGGEAGASTGGTSGFPFAAAAAWYGLSAFLGPTGLRLPEEAGQFPVAPTHSPKMPAAVGTASAALGNASGGGQADSHGGLRAHVASTKRNGKCTRPIGRSVETSAHSGSAFSHPLASTDLAAPAPHATGFQRPEVSASLDKPDESTPQPGPPASSDSVGCSVGLTREMLRRHRALFEAASGTQAGSQLAAYCSGSDSRLGLAGSRHGPDLAAEPMKPKVAGLGQAMSVDDTSGQLRPGESACLEHKRKPQSRPVGERCRRQKPAQQAPERGNRGAAVSGPSLRLCCGELAAVEPGLAGRSNHFGRPVEEKLPDGHVEEEEEGDDEEDDEEDEEEDEGMVAEEDEEEDEEGVRHPQEGDPDFVETACRWADCQINFETQEALVKHISNEHIAGGKKSFICFWRDCVRGARPFKAQYMLVVHMRRHTGEKPHKCNVS